jgi:hypothetical protein
VTTARFLMLASMSEDYDTLSLHGALILFPRRRTQQILHDARVAMWRTLFKTIERVDVNLVEG